MQLPPFARSLSARLLVLTVGFVMLAEVLIYLPSAARYRVDWLNERLAKGHLAALAVVAAPEGMVTDELKEELLRHVGAASVDVYLTRERVLMLARARPPDAAASFDLRSAGALTLIADTVRLLCSTGDRMILVRGFSNLDPAVRVDMLLDEGPLRRGLLDYSGRVLGLSVIIALVTAGLVFVALIVMTVRPMRRLAEAMMAFKRDPENTQPTAWLATDRTDEVGIAQRELIAMQEAVRQAFRQRERLAALGTAVAKINHDIRGILASATLLSERLLESDDPEVRRTGPRILASLERAAQLCTQTLDFTRDGVMPLMREAVDLHGLVEEAGATVLSERRMPEGGGVSAWDNGVTPGLTVQADRDQLFRVLVNLGRNALEAGATRVEIAAEVVPGWVRLVVRDDGPGLPPRALENLFRPFRSTTKPNGTGLGLAIAREVMRAHGGDLKLRDTCGAGTTFTLSLPGAGMQA